MICDLFYFILNEVPTELLSFWGDKFEDFRFDLIRFTFILIFLILVVGSWILFDLHHNIISYRTIIIIWIFSLIFVCLMKRFFIYVIIRFYSRIGEIEKLLIICYILVGLNRSGCSCSNFFSYDFFFLIFSTGWSM